jgi:hypothetical protein
MPVYKYAYLLNEDGETLTDENGNGLWVSYTIIQNTQWRPISGRGHITTPQQTVVGGLATESGEALITETSRIVIARSEWSSVGKHATAWRPSDGRGNISNPVESSVGGLATENGEAVVTEPTAITKSRSIWGSVPKAETTWRPVSGVGSISTPDATYVGSETAEVITTESGEAIVTNRSKVTKKHHSVWTDPDASVIP